MDKEIDPKVVNLDFSFKGKNELLQAILNVDIFGRPKCKTRRRRVYGTKGNNRR